MRLRSIFSNSMKIGSAALLLLWAGKGYSQQDSQYTQYMYSANTINPAYAGVREVLSMNGSYRNQWVGLEGAPETVAFSLNSPIGVKGVGMGLNFFSDQIGAVSESNITADFSYTVDVARDTELSFGLKGGINMFGVDVEKLNIFNPSDEMLYTTNKTAPVVGLGVYLHSENWYVGLSSPNVLETNYFDEVAVSTATEKAHFYLIGGYVFDLNENLKFKPAILTKMVAGAPLSIDMSANFWLHETVSLGASYRYDAAVSALAGFQVTDQFMIGYSYDYDTTELAGFNSGSHEVFLRFELGTRSRQQFQTCYF